MTIKKNKNNTLKIIKKQDPTDEICYIKVNLTLENKINITSQRKIIRELISKTNLKNVNNSEVSNTTNTTNTTFYNPFGKLLNGPMKKIKKEKINKSIEIILRMNNNSLNNSTINNTFILQNKKYL